jgi:hypothetical protein
MTNRPAHGASKIVNQQSADPNSTAMNHNANEAKPLL